MKKLIFFSIITLLTIPCFSQSYKENRKEADRIKDDTSYYWGESEACESVNAANEKAVSNLINDITSRFKSDALYFPGQDSESEQLRRVFMTYSKAIETSSRQIVLQQKSETVVFRCIKQEDIRDMLQQRRDDIQYYIDEGFEFEQQGAIGYALRDFYWSMMLCYSHPNGKHLMMRDPDNENSDLIPMYNWLVKHVNQILTDINVIPRSSVKGDNMLDVELVFNYLGSVINNVVYEYNDGTGLVVNVVNNGKSLVQLHDKKMKVLNIRFDLEYKNEAENFNRDVYNVMQVLKGQIHFNTANKSLSLDKVDKKDKKVDEPQPVANKSPEYNEGVKEMDNLLSSLAVEEDVYLKSMKIIEKAIRDKKYEDAQSCFTDDGYAMLMKLAEYGSISIIGKQLDYKFIDFNGNIICRSIPMQFKFKTNSVGFNQDVVFRFDSQSHKVTSLSFRLSDDAERDILGKGTWDRKSRMILINFLEDYQTAYALKRLDYLDKIFSDNALIIIGVRVENAPTTTDGMHLSNKEQFELIRKSKKDYIRDLGRAFKSKEYINLRFTDTDFTKSSNGKELYGVQIKQNYYSSSYNDIGYLFLVVDLSKEMPLIHVRTWQPDKTDAMDVINMDDFEWN